MKSFVAVLLIFTITPAIVPAADAVKDRLLAAHGLDQFDQVEEIRFTFVVERPNSRTARHWEWRTGENVVTYSEEKDGNVVMITYDRGELEGASEAVISADRKFINDSFWLMWPLHASWSDDAKVEEVDGDTIRLSYPPTGGGYSPGDMYVIDIDEDGLATRWAFHKGGAGEASLVNTFEDYAQAGPLKLATTHRNEDGFALLFEDIAVKLRGEPEWKAP